MLLFQHLAAPTGLRSSMPEQSKSCKAENAHTSDVPPHRPCSLCTSLFTLACGSPDREEEDAFAALFGGDWLWTPSTERLCLSGSRTHTLLVCVPGTHARTVTKTVLYPGKS